VIAFLTNLRAVFAAIPWMEIMLVLAGAWLVIGLYKLHLKRSNQFELDDLFLDRNGKADLYKVIVLVMAGLSVYTVLKLLEHDKPVETLLLGVLAIFVGGRAFNAAFSKEDAGDRAPATPKEEEVK